MDFAKLMRVSVFWRRLDIVMILNPFVWFFIFCLNLVSRLKSNPLASVGILVLLLKQEVFGLQVFLFF